MLFRNITEISEDCYNLKLEAWLTPKDNLERDRRNEDRKRESAQRALAPLGGGYVKEDSLASFLRQVERKYNQLQGGMAYYHNYYNYYY